MSYWISDTFSYYFGIFRFHKGLVKLVLKSIPTSFRQTEQVIFHMKFSI